MQELRSRPASMEIHGPTEASLVCQVAICDGNFGCRVKRPCWPQRVEQILDERIFKFDRGNNRTQRRSPPQGLVTRERLGAFEIAASLRFPGGDVGGASCNECGSGREVRA